MKTCGTSGTYGDGATWWTRIWTLGTVFSVHLEHDRRLYVLHLRLGRLSCSFYWRPR